MAMIPFKGFRIFLPVSLIGIYFINELLVTLYVLEKLRHAREEIKTTL